MTERRRLVCPLLVVMALALLAGPAAAIPAYARKYGTSCATCHVAYPKLTPFGEAFKNGGYRFPGRDSEFVEDEPVKLGSEAYKKTWPDSIWPSDLPNMPPLSVRGTMVYDSNPDAVGRNVDDDFQVPRNLWLLAGGTFGEKYSFYSHTDLSSEGMNEIEPGRLQLQYEGVLGLENSHLRVGLIEPAAVPFSTYTFIGLSNYAINTYSPTLSNDLRGGGGHHGGAFALGRSQRGFEVEGFPDGRWQWAAGLSNGNQFFNAATNTFDNNSSKDFWVRLAHKFGGAPLVGTPASQDPSGDAWKERSFRIGVSGYWGRNEEPDANLALFDSSDITDYRRVLIDFDARYDDLEVFGATMWTEDDLHRQVARSDFRIDTTLTFVEAHYVVHPWLVPYARYEWVDRDAGLVDLERFIVGSAASLVANIKLNVEGQFESQGNDRLLVGLDFAF